MKVVMVYDTFTDEVTVVSKSDFNQKDLINYLVDYFKVTMEDLLSDSRKKEVIMCKQFIIYWATELYNTAPKELRKILNYAEDSAIITTSLYKVRDMFDTKDVTYIRPYNNHVRYLLKFGIVKDLL